VYLLGQPVVSLSMRFYHVSFSTVAAVVGIMYLVQGSKYLLGVVGMIFARCYVNSMLAVLNARKTIRERDQNVYDLSPI